GAGGVRRRRAAARRGHRRRRPRPHPARRLAIPRPMSLRSDDTLSQPRVRRSLGIHYDPDAFGRFSEGIARFLGTGRYLAWQTGIVIVWIAFNAVAVGLRWDPYPFILLNLAFSTQAAYAAPLILLAQNRQAERDKEQQESDREVTFRTQADAEYLAREI